MFIVVIFFLIYGVEVFFKVRFLLYVLSQKYNNEIMSYFPNCRDYFCGVVLYVFICTMSLYVQVRGGFTISRVPTVISSTRRQDKRIKKTPSLDRTNNQESGELLIVKSPDAIINDAKEDVSTYLLFVYDK